MHIPEFNRIFVFGDSLMDNGNRRELEKLHSNRKIAEEPYWNGRFTNGYNAPDYLLLFFEEIYKNSNGKPNIKLINKAVGGATTRGYGEGKYYVPSTLKQVQTHVNNNGFFSERDLIIFGGGGNNFNFGLSKLKIKYLFGIAEDYKKTLDILINSGAKNILLYNVPDISHTVIFNSHTNFISKYLFKGLGKFITFLTEGINHKIDRYVLDKKNQVNISIIDVFNLMRIMSQSPEEFEFKPMHNCMIRDFGIGGHEKVKEKSRKVKTPEDEYSYFFFDFLHPSTHAHCIVAKIVLNMLADDMKHPKYPDMHHHHHVNIETLKRYIQNVESRLNISIKDISNPASHTI